MTACKGRYEKPSLAIAVGLALVMASSALLASEPEAASTTAMPAASRAFEIGFAAGYTHPFGKLPGAIAHYGSIGPGGAVAVDVGYRIDPHWSVSSSWQVHESIGDSGFAQTLGVLGLTSAAQCTHRFLPFDETSPFLSLGTGYRALWLLPSDTESAVFHGVEVAKVAAGIDLLRPHASASVGALIGFDLSVFMFGDVGGTSRVLDDPRLVSFIFVAMVSTFDLGGERVANAAR